MTTPAPPQDGDRRPCVYTQPAWTAAIARMHGLDAPAPETARTLEIGAATGDNLIALAARYPRARFLGVDASSAFVEKGRARIAALGLENVELRAGDFTELAEGEFDYILAHDALSRAPEATGEAVLRLAERRLTAAGLFVAGYDVLPGAHVRQAPRDLLARRVAARHGGVPEPRAWYFSEMVARAAARGLGYVSEAKPWYAFSDAHAPEFVRELRALGGEDRVSFEEAFDFLAGVHVRVSVFARTALAARANPLIARERCADLRYALTGPLERTEHGRAPADAPVLALAAGFATYACAGRGYPAQTPARERLYAHLAERSRDSGAAISPRDAARALAAPLEPTAAQTDEAVEVFFDLLRGGALHVFVDDPGAVGVSDRPRAFAPARHDAACGAVYTVNRINDVIYLDVPPMVRFLALCDGARTREELVAATLELHDAGLLPLAADAASTTPPREAARAWTERTLRLFALNRLLDG